MTTDNFWNYFHEIYETLPRQGPGDRESTLHALRLLPALTHEHRILDIGCGVGAQTLDLAGATQARIVATDNHAPFLALLSAHASSLGLEERMTTQVADMADLPFPDGSFDVIWSEGAIFIMGFAQGLSAWRRLLAAGGHMVVSEFCWLSDDPPAEVRELFGDGSDDVGDVAARRKAIAESGYTLLHEFMLPATGWWDNYYVPLGEALGRFRKKHEGNAEALAVAARSQREIDVYRRHPETFGYVFFVMRRDDGLIPTP